MRMTVASGQTKSITPADSGAPGLEPYLDAPPARSAAPNLGRLFAALRRFKWLLAGISLLGLGGGLLATRYVHPDYEVKATIWIETPARDRAGSPIQGEELLDSRAWIELLTTFKVLDPVVQGRKLYLTPGNPEDESVFSGFELASRFLPGQFELSIEKDGKRYQLKQRSGLYTEAGALSDSVGRTIGFRWVPRTERKHWGNTIGFEIVSPREASVALTHRLERNLREENFLVLTLREKNAEHAALTMNALIHRFVEEAADQKRSKLTLLAQVLDSQVVDQDRRLKDAEQRLESFRVGTVTMAREEAPVAPGLAFTQPTVYGSFFAQRNALDSLRRDRESIQEAGVGRRILSVPLSKSVWLKRAMAFRTCDASFSGRCSPPSLST